MSKKKTPPAYLQKSIRKPRNPATARRTLALPTALVAYTSICISKLEALITPGPTSRRHVAVENTLVGGRVCGWGGGETLTENWQAP